QEVLVSSPSRADELFRRGKERLAANDYAAACPLLAESYQLDPATGGLLALALCHERQGKLASALREYEQAAQRAHAEGRPDREQAARVQATALRARASTLTIQTQDPAAEVRVLLNGTPLTAEELRAPIPVDGGFVLVEAEAAGKTPWQRRFTVADSVDALKLVIPSLTPLSPPVTALVPSAPASAPSSPAPAPATPAPPSKKPAPKRLTGAQWAGIGLFAAGAAAAGVAAGFTVKAARENKDSSAGCVDDVCTPEARELRLSARRAGNIATVSAAASGAFVAAGLVSYLIGRRRDDRRSAARTAPRLSAWLSPSGAGASVTGGF
ncbi:MAG TPA: hypothetical protein VFZ61_14920, partial [Polyangiales bacterium]